MPRCLSSSVIAGILLVSLGSAQPSEPGTEISIVPEKEWDDRAVLASLHAEVQGKIETLRKKMEARGLRIYLMGGARSGSAAVSMHNQALAVDVNIDYMTTGEVAEELRAVGFTCVIPYFSIRYEPCHMAHADLRGTSLAVGPYAPGGSKADDCPGAAVSRTTTCDNSVKAQWNYLRVIPTAAKRQLRMAHLQNSR